MEEGKGTIHFVMVHGYEGGAWCWYKVRTHLEESGYKVTCLDLKGSGIDPSTPDSILSFPDYNLPLIHFLDHHVDDDHKVVLVGLSAGGLSVTDATHKFGNSKIQLAVYVAATMLQHGFFTHQDLVDGVPEVFSKGPSRPEEATSAIMDNKFQRVTRYHMCPPEDFALTTMLQRSGPLEAVKGAKFLGGQADTVPRVYIKTIQDKVLKPEQQESMIKRWPPLKVFSLDSDHNPCFSAPLLLSGLLVHIATSSLPA